MKLSNYPLPSPTAVDFAFPTYNTDARLLEMAKEQGFADYKNPYNQLVSKVFFEGCGGFERKEGIPDDYVKKLYEYSRCLLGSWAPKHEHKMAVCAFLFSEIFEPTHIPKEAIIETRDVQQAKA